MSEVPGEAQQSSEQVIKSQELQKESDLFLVLLRTHDKSKDVRRYFQQCLPEVQGFTNHQQHCEGVEFNKMSKGGVDLAPWYMKTKRL